MIDAAQWRVDERVAMGKPGIDVVFKADMSMLALVVLLVLTEFTGAAEKMANYWVDQWIANEIQTHEMKTLKRDSIEPLENLQNQP